MICGLFAVLYLQWGGRRLARGIDGRAWLAIEEFGCAVAPLLAFALIWLLADSAREMDSQRRSSSSARSGPSRMRARQRLRIGA
jgi:hypothetical protein